MGELSGLSYPVILRPSDVKFTCPTVPTTFDNGERLCKVLDDMCRGRLLPKEIPPMNVVWYCDKWEWYTVNNRRLWLFQQLEKLELCKYASMNRVEVMNTSYQHPVNLYAEASLYDPPQEEESRALNSNNLLSLHQLEDGQITPPPTDEEDCAMSVLSFTSVAKSPQQRSSSRSQSGRRRSDRSRSGRRRSGNAKSGQRSARGQSRSHRMRTSSTGTTVGSVEDIYVERGVTVHARKKYRDEDDDDDLEIKMEVKSFSPGHIRGRSHSKQRGDSISCQESRIRSCSRGRSCLRARSGSRARSRSRGRSQVRGRSQSRGKRNRFGENLAQSPGLDRNYRSPSVRSTRGRSQVRRQSQSRGKRNRSTSWESHAQSPGRDRNYRSTSVMSTASFKSEKVEDCQMSFNQPRIKSSKGISGNGRAKSMSSLPRGSGHTEMHYNSFQSEGNNSNFRDRSRAKSISNIRDRSRAKSVSNIRDRSRAKSVSNFSGLTRDNSVSDINDRSRCKSVTALLSEPSRHGSLYSVNTRYRSRSKSAGRTLHGDPGSKDDTISVYERRRTSSGCSDYSAGRSASDVASTRRGERESSVCSVKSHRSVKSNASSRSYQLDKFRHERAIKYQRPRREKFIDNDFTPDYEYTADSNSLLHRSDSISSDYGSDGALTVKTGIQLSNLYSLWATRRAEFLEARRKGELHLMYGPEEGYLCGLCFKKFFRVVDLQQHCEELLHYACITCGRFFNTYTALGQHCNALRHTKD